MAPGEDARLWAGTGWVLSGFRRRRSWHYIHNSQCRYDAARCRIEHRSAGRPDQQARHADTIFMAVHNGWMPFIPSSAEKGSSVGREAVARARRMT